MSFAPTLAFMLIRFYEQPSYRTNMQMKQHVEHFFTLNFFFVLRFPCRLVFAPLSLSLRYSWGKSVHFYTNQSKKIERRHCKWEGNVDFATAVFDFSISNFIHDAQLDEPLAFSKTYIPKNRIKRSRKKKIPKRKTVSPKGLSLSRWCDLRYCRRSNCVSKDLNVKRIFMCINSYSLSITRRFCTVCTCFGWVGMRILSFLFPLSCARIWFMRQKCIKCYIITTTTA